MIISKTKTKRIDVVDALRGFAILGILLVHNIDHFHFPEFPTETSPMLGLLDKISFKAVQLMFMGKTYAIFTILFGFSFFIQHNNQKKIGKDFGPRFMWRMILLAVFAIFNSAFFLAGDVLILFVIVSPVLLISRNWSDRAILLFSIILIAQPFGWANVVVSQFNNAHQIPDFDYSAMHSMLVDNAKNGNIFDFLWLNATMGLKVTILASIYSGSLMQFAGLFLLGFYIGRKQYFVSSLDNIRVWKRVAIASLISFLLFVILTKIVSRQNISGQQIILGIFGAWKNLSFTFILISLFVIVYENVIIRKILSGLRYYGKMSLTNYITQSIFGAFIYLPVGFYLAPRCGYFFSIVIAFGVFIVQMLFSIYWLGKYKQGPLEKIWHKWTWINS